MKINLQSITIHWAEGSNSNYDKFPKTYTSYADVNKAMRPIYEDFAKDGEGYNKVKFSLLFEDNETYEGRLYISENFDNPIKTNNVIGEHIEDFLNHIINNDDNEENVKDARNFINNYQLN